MPGAAVVIVGGGMSGLAAVYEFARRNAPLLLLEAAPTLDGVVKIERIDGFVIDAGPGGFLTHKPAAIDVYRELRMDDRLCLQFQRGRTINRGGRPACDAVARDGVDARSIGHSPANAAPQRLTA